jgi:hypothetical protein
LPAHAKPERDLAALASLAEPNWMAVDLAAGAA